MDLLCSFYDLISYQEPPDRPISVLRKNYSLSYIKWLHCYEVFGDLISEFNNRRIGEERFLNCMRELGMFAYEISGTHERDSRESQIFLQEHMDYLYETPILLEMFPIVKRIPRNPIPRKYQALDFWLGKEMKRADIETFEYFDHLFPHKQFIRNPTSLRDLPSNIYRFYEIISSYEPIRNRYILFDEHFIFSFYLLMWPVIKRTGYAVKNLWMFVYQIAAVLNNFTMKDYVIVDCNHFYPNDPLDPYYCGRAFTTITAPDIFQSKFLLFNTIPPMDMSPFKLSRYKNGIEVSGPPLETKEWEPYIDYWNKQYG
jgi:hypothetical protein